MLGTRYESALIYACHIHAAQRRKGAGVPYIAHLLSVSALAIEHGGTEDEAIAALLHDAVEDQGGAARLEDIRARFGEAVAEIVEGCTDGTPDENTGQKPPWRARKEVYIAHLGEVAPSVRFVSLCDKLHNARAVLSDYLTLGEELWPRFSGGRETIWYYQALAERFAELESAADPQRLRPGLRVLRRELQSVVEEIAELSQAQS